VTTAGPIAADFFDGRSSARHLVQATREGNLLRIAGAAVALEVPVEHANVQPRIGRTPVRVLLPGNALLLAEATELERLLPIPRSRGLAHRLESHLGAVFASLAGVVAAAWLFVQFGVPWAAREIAQRIPPEMERDIATQSLNQLDGYVFSRSNLLPERQAKLRALFAELRGSARGAAANAQLEFRDGGLIGANAFALPGGTVVATDQLVVLLRDDERVAAVLAHELGHLEHRHGSRQILQSSIIGLLSAAIAGDASTLTTVVVGLPTMLIHSGYSRDFEREADRYAYGLLEATQRSPRLLGEALEQLENAHPARTSSCSPDDAPPQRKRHGPTAEDLGYLSTHPATPERIRDAEAAAR
jgi:Zn-dependent protease with chaperone function